jgi:hypothetical protein
MRDPYCVFAGSECREFFCEEIVDWMFVVAGKLSLILVVNNGTYYGSGSRLENWSLKKLA